MSATVVTSGIIAIASVVIAWTAYTNSRAWKEVDRLNREATIKWEKAANTWEQIATREGTTRQREEDR